MSISDHNSPPIPFAPKPRKSMDRVRHEALYPPETGIPYEPDRAYSKEELDEAVAKLTELHAQQKADEAPEEPTDVQYVANNLDRLRYLDLKEAVTGMLGKEMPKDINEAIDRVAEWAAANKTKVAA